MNIRKCPDADLDIVKEITAICFDGVSIDQNIEKEFGPIAGHGWRWRKKRHIDADVDAHADGMFVAEVDGEVVGYITTRVDEEAKIGGIPNYAVLPRHQRKGIGLKLVETAIEHLKGEGMAYIRIETLEKRAALVPPPRFHLLRYHGVLAPRAWARERIVPAQPVAEPSARGGRLGERCVLRPSAALGDPAGAGVFLRHQRMRGLWRAPENPRRPDRSGLDPDLSAGARAAGDAPAEGPA